MKWYRDLSSSRGRHAAASFVIEGKRAISQIAQSHPESIIEILSTDERPRGLDRYPWRVLSRKQFDSVSQTETPQGMMAIIRLPEDVDSGRIPESPGERILLLEDIQDPGNVGTLIRTAAAFDFSGVILTRKSADPFSPKCAQASAGSLLSLWIRRTIDHMEMVDRLKGSGYGLLVADVHGTEDPATATYNEKLVIALGNETAGPSRALKQRGDRLLRISTNQQKAESLNVAACGAILMYLGSRR